MTGSPPEFDGADLTGVRFHRTRLNDAWFRLSDLSGAVLRDVSLAGAEIDSDLEELAGLRINGIEVAPLIEAELARRDPARALAAAAHDPAGLRAAWDAIQDGWAATGARAAALPDGAVEESVDGEWSFAQTLRHLVFATDAWLGAIRGEEQPFHPWGVPFDGLIRFTGRTPEDFGVDPTAAPSYPEVLELRADRVARMRAFLAGATPESLARTNPGPLWHRGEPISALDCARVVLNEECEHRRFAERDLDAIEAMPARSAE
ncbi:MAG TPA: DinB family protein [Jatrophihabitans sp.]|nr:DinB family protein [Jatrophihabitans sp.]